MSNLKEKGILPPSLLPNNGVKNVLGFKFLDSDSDGELPIWSKAKSILKTLAFPLILVGFIILGVLVSKSTK